MKNALISTYDIRGGAAIAAYRLNVGLRQLGMDSRMIVLHKNSSDDAVLQVEGRVSPEKSFDEFLLSRILQSDYVDNHRTDISNTMFSIPYAGYDLLEVPHVYEADVINLHWVARYQSISTIKKLADHGRPIVWTLHDQWAFTGGCHYSAGCERFTSDCRPCPQLSKDPSALPAGVLQDKLELLEGTSLTLVTPSGWLASCAKRSRLFRNLRTEVIPNSLDTESFYPVPKAEAKKRMGIGPDVTTLLFGASDGSEIRKGFKHLVSALSICRDSLELKELIKQGRLRFLCFGSPPAELEAIGVPVVDLGYLNSSDDLRWAYSAADVFILPSLEDNLPNTILESMSVGTPVIAFEAGGVPELVKHGVTGLLAPAGDAKTLSEAIEALILNPGMREAMGMTCRQVAVKEYSLPVQAKRYELLFRELSRKTASIPTKQDRTSQQEVRKQVVADESGSSVQTRNNLNTELGSTTEGIYKKLLSSGLKTLTVEIFSLFQASIMDRDRWQRLYNETLENRNYLKTAYEMMLVDRDRWHKLYDETLQDRDAHKQAYTTILADRDRWHKLYDETLQDRDAHKQAYTAILADRDRWKKLCDETLGNRDAYKEAYESMLVDRDRWQKLYTETLENRDVIQKLYGDQKARLEKLGVSDGEVLQSLESYRKNYEAVEKERTRWQREYDILLEKSGIEIARVIDQKNQLLRHPLRYLRETLRIRFSARDR